MGENHTSLIVFCSYMLVVGAARFLKRGLSTLLAEVYAIINWALNF